MLRVYEEDLHGSSPKEHEQENKGQEAFYTEAISRQVELSGSIR